MAQYDNTHIVKDVVPEGNIVNDNDIGVDHLGHSVYAEALSQRIESAKTPVTIGIFARWGSGKSFLVNHVASLLAKYQRQREIGEVVYTKSKSHCGLFVGRTFLLILLVGLLVISSLWAIFPRTFLALMISSNSTNVDQTNNVTITVAMATNVSMTSASTDESSDGPMEFWAKTSRYIAFAILLSTLLFVCVVVCCSGDWWSSQFFGNFRLISYVAFTKMPIKQVPSSIVTESHEDDVILRKKPRSKKKVALDLQRYIFVNFNAWEYAGSDTLWAGIVTNLTDAIEAEFGSVTSRLFRMFSVDATSRGDGRAKKASARLFVRIKTSVNYDVTMGKMKHFGVVRYCKTYADWQKNNATNRKEAKTADFWWVVEYSNYREGQDAKRYFDLNQIRCTYDDPGTANQTSNVRQNNTNHRSKANDIELDNLTHGDGNDTESLLSNEPKTENIRPKAEEEDKGFLNHFMKYPKTTCKFPILYWWILISVSVITLPVMTYVVANSLQLDVFRTPRAVPVAIQIFAWMPGVSAAAFVMLKFAWAMFHSQRSRIHSALRGSRGNMGNALGFMDKVKTEVRFVNKLIQCVAFSHKIRYKVIITIDDLDRVPLDKVKSVLEAVNILLSDRSSPFVCLIALDSRVAVKCIEDDMGSALLKANVNGHEYIKKIINLPFCLPEVENRKKRKFIEGLIDISDTTKKQRMKRQRESIDKNRVPSSASSDQSDSLSDQQTPRGRRPGDLNNIPDTNDVKETDLRTPTQPMAAFQGTSQPIEPHLQTTSNSDVTDAGPIGQQVENGVEKEDSTYRSFIPGETTPSLVKYQCYKTRHRQDRQREVNSHLNRNVTTTTGRKMMIPGETTVEKKSTKPKLDSEDFLFKCRDYFYTSEMVHRHLHGNPRNIKRIFNILSLTALIVNCHINQRQTELLFKDAAQNKKTKLTEVGEDEEDERTEDLSHDFVFWIILTDQWPYRMSYILQVIEDADQRSNAGIEASRINDDKSLFEIYEKIVKPELQAIKSSDEGRSLMSLDVDPDLFYSVLKEIKENGNFIDKGRAKFLQKYTINLDHSLRQSIAFQRDGVSIEIEKTDDEDNKAICTEGDQTNDPPFNDEPGPGSSFKTGYSPPPAETGKSTTAANVLRNARSPRSSAQSKFKFKPGRNYIDRRQNDDKFNDSHLLVECEQQEPVHKHERPHSFVKTNV